MDIYKYGEEINYNADYYDFNTGYTYHLQEYKEIKDNPAAQIRVTLDGETIGYAKKI